MAAHIELDEIENLPIQHYKEVRKQLNSGDLFFASGDYLVSKAIEKVTDSPWSHVGIIFNLQSIDRVLLLESVEDMGVRFAPLSKYLSDYEDGTPYQGRAVIARCTGVNVNVIDGIASFGIDELTRPYDKAEIANILARVTLGIGKNSHNKEYICSELVYECFSKAGIQFRYNSHGFISPEDIWVDNKVSLVGRIL